MIKRLLDFSTAVLLLVVLSPILAVVAALIRLTLGRPVIFRQPRAGLNGRIFTVLKFRTMTNERGADGNLLSDGERLLPVGRLLRKTSLDEVPQLWNVIRGDMSLVGPRPLLVEYLPLYSPEQARRHEVLPGITGWAQVNGRNAISWEEKFALDVWYVDNRSLLLDLRILVMTLAKVVRRENVSQANQATVQKFTGSATKTGSEGKA